MGNKYTDAAFKSHTVRGVAKLVLWSLCHRARNEDAPEGEMTFFCGGKVHMEAGWCFPSYTTIARDGCVSVSTAKRGVIKLLKMGIVSVVRHGGQQNDTKASNIYCVNYEALVGSSTVVENDNNLEGDNSNPVEEVAMPSPEEADKQAAEYAQEINILHFDGAKLAHEEALLKLYIKSYMLGTAPSLEPGTFVPARAIEWMLYGLNHNKEWRRKLVAASDPIDFVMANLSEITYSARDEKSVFDELKEQNPEIKNDISHSNASSEADASVSEVSL